MHYGKITAGLWLQRWVSKLYFVGVKMTWARSYPGGVPKGWHPLLSGIGLIILTNHKGLFCCVLTCALFLRTKKGCFAVTYFDHLLGCRLALVENWFSHMYARIRENEPFDSVRKIRHYLVTVTHATLKTNILYQTIKKQNLPSTRTWNSK